MTSAYTTLWKPGASQKLFIFGVSTNSYLTLREFDTSIPNNTQLGPATDPTSVPSTGLIIPDTSIAAISYGGLTRVFGFIATKASDGTQQTSLYQLSPVWQAVKAGTSKTKSTAAVAGKMTDGEVGYVYYIEVVGKVIEQSLTWKNPYIVQNQQLHKATYLAACLTEKGGRFIAYQLDTKYIEVYDVSGKHPCGQLVGTGNAKESTPLAIVSYSKVGENKSYINVYWQQTGTDKLWRSQSEDNGSNWTDKILSNADSPDGSSISAIFDGVAQKVVLTYLYSAQDIKCWDDEVV
ncbi:uncharacterized protein CCOS01_01822 [Colletotrichum costaricense]|uniref:Fucose-specific lectin n=1 Tax=Colletotrichum costaricense TaxID=1209916 RepID=A0AAI9Z6H9_9PEZI|nr:uncharacterized protein CCOS01_01822 [Colletotrichum costaricense]KAK1536502.1 hypothetical protein CCOS01_01822 [Colletotrichum costaricense]